MTDDAYRAAGVNYDRLDAFKRACQREAATTAPALAAHGLREPASVRGESAYLVETDHGYIAHVEEGLGTKNLVADAMAKLTGKSFYHAIGVDTVATMVNDLITCGALPWTIAMHAGVGDAEWFSDETRASELARGFAHACRESNAVWGGGETPALRGIIEPGAICLAGSAVGRISPKSNRITGNIKHGDVIILIASSGVQTNGLTLCRKIADKLPKGYLTPISDGRSFGEALLDPSVIYVKLVAAMQQAHIPIHYAAHVTGHGWRKLMRLDEPFVYRLTNLKKPLPVFEFLMQHGPLTQEEAYATYNMGAGFGLYVDPKDAQASLNIAKQNGYDAWIAGSVEKQGARKAVLIEPLGITYEADSLRVR